MIEVLSGLPGGGKSLQAVLRIIEALRAGRHVLTNVSIKPWELAFHASWHPAFIFKSRMAKVRAAERYYNRIHLLSDDDVREFWKYCYGGNLRFFIVLDEIQLYFDSADWAKTPKDFKSYLAQHRKGGDDLLLVSQHTKNIDIHFRRMTARYWHTHSTKGLPLFGILPLPEMFISNAYYGEVDTVIARRVITPSKKIFNLYDTMREYDNGLRNNGVNARLLDLDLRNKEGLRFRCLDDIRDVKPSDFQPVTEADKMLLAENMRAMNEGRNRGF